MGRLRMKIPQKKMKQNRKIPLINSRWVPVAENCHTGKSEGTERLFSSFYVFDGENQNEQ